MPILVQCKNVLDPMRSFLSTYRERPQIHPPTAMHLFLSRYRDSSLTSSLWYSRLAEHVHGIPDLLCMFMVLITDALHI